ADVAYERTELAEAEITYIDVSNVSPPLSYPEGYFQIANPVQYAMLKEQAANQTPGIPGIPSFTPNSNIANELRNTKPVLPKANPNVVEGEIPDSLFEFETDDETKDDIEKVNRPRGGKVAGNDPKGQTPDGQTAANDNTKMPEDPAETETQDVSKQDQVGVFINKRPIRDMAFEALEKVEKKEVTLEKPFKVVIAATLAAGKDGKTIVLKDPRMVPTEFDATNDPAMVELAQDAIIASG